MNSPILDAFKSLKDVSDEVIAKQKRVVIKEDLDEKELTNTFNIPKIESTFTASNLWEGLDDEELDEEILDEKLPKDLAQAYRRADKYRVNFTGDDRRQSEVDYEKANYEEITPEQALQARKDGRIQDLRILKDGNLIVYRDDAYPLTGIEWVGKEDSFTNRNGKEIRDTRLMPLSHVVKIADKIYLTDEKENRFAFGKWVDGDYVYDDPTQQARVQQRKDMIPDTGKHNKERKGSYGTPEYYEKSAKEYESEIEEKEKELADLEAKWEAGDISRNAYQEKKDSLNK